MKHIKIILFVFFSCNTLISFSQKLDGVYIKADCFYIISKKYNDTIIAYGNPKCSLFKIDTTINGTWIMYSQNDSTLIIYKATVFNHKLEGIEYSLNQVLSYKLFVNYNDGKKNGSFLQTTLDNKVKYFCDYNMDKISGDNYFYEYGNNGKLSKIKRYNKKGKLKEEKLFDTGVYEKYYTPKK
ncbi:MAG: hypothetical protein HY951_00630 [Bacteroidia bacterium]|nr:hypothetical protein [Bacteroidia bacterium]